MPELKTYDLFISHAWNYNSDYYNLVNLLENANNFKWRNYSVPVHDPIIDPNTLAGKKRLTDALKGQIKYANAVLILSAMYAAHSEWIQAEIDIAIHEYNKPIIGVMPRGQERVPLAVQNVAQCMVGWNTASIVDAIRKYSL